MQQAVDDLWEKWLPLYAQARNVHLGYSVIVADENALRAERGLGLGKVV